MSENFVAARTVIVDQSEMVHPWKMRQEVLTFGSLSFRSKLECIQWLAKRRLLRNSYKCSACLIPMTFLQRSQSSDGYRWKCKKCEGAASLRIDSFFAHSHLLLEQILIIIYGWSRDYTQVLLLIHFTQVPHFIEFRV